MKRWVVNWKFWSLLGIGIIIAVLVPVFAARQQGDLTATPYADVIRFEAGGAVASLQIKIFNLSGRALWDSGLVSGGIVDWDRRNDFGERLAYGAYLYTAQGWDAQETLVLERKGKLALLPGDKVNLSAAPGSDSLPQSSPSIPDTDQEPRYAPMAYNEANFYVSGRLGVGTDTPSNKMEVVQNHDGMTCLELENAFAGGHAMAQLAMGTGVGKAFALSKFGGAFNWFTWSGIALADWAMFRSDSGVAGLIFATGGASPLLFATADTERMRVAPSGCVGIGTTNPVATLQVQGDEANLLALYDSANPVDIKFKVAKTGNVYADGSYYSPTTAVQAGSADVAERINTSEWVEPGNVVEIDPDHPGFFRKARSPYSTRVAGIISTSPGVVLGNNFDASADKWEDNRPVLAIAGRVPVRVTAENGAIQVGDLLVSSSAPGVAMKALDQVACIGATIGKAMGPLLEEEGTGVIMAQVMLR